MPATAYTIIAARSTRVRPNRSTTAPANPAVSPMIRAGTVSTIGTSTATPGTPAKCCAMSGSTGAISTAPSTDIELAPSRSSSCGVPAVRSFDCNVIVDLSQGFRRCDVRVLRPRST